MLSHLLTTLALTLPLLHPVLATDAVNLLRDGNFEAVADNHIGLIGTTSGGWALQSAVEFEKNTDRPQTHTPYGEKFVRLYCYQNPSGHGDIVNATHAVRHLEVGGAYSLGYAYLPDTLFDVPEAYEVTFKVTLNDEVLDCVTLSNKVDYPHKWGNRTASFVAAKDEGKLRLILDCTTLTGYHDNPQQWFYVYVDEVGIFAQS